MKERFPFSPPKSAIPDTLAALKDSDRSLMVDTPTWRGCHVWERVQQVQGWTVAIGFVVALVVPATLGRVNQLWANVLLACLALWMIYALVLGRRLANQTIESKIVVEWARLMLDAQRMDVSDGFLTKGVGGLTRLIRRELPYAGSRFLSRGIAVDVTDGFATYLGFLGESLNTGRSVLQTDLTSNSAIVRRRQWASLRSPVDTATVSVIRRISGRIVAVILSAVAVYAFCKGIANDELDWFLAGIPMLMVAIHAWLYGSIRTAEDFRAVLIVWKEH